ncbi:MAG: diaminopimelate epimerase [Acidimicrobiales bacterium]
MALRTLQKWHGAGNDFLIDVTDDAAAWWGPEHARAVCARSTGVGADGLIVATLGDVVSMVLYNADGSLAEMSGNGIRCMAAAVRRVTGGSWNSLEVQTSAGGRTVTLEMKGDAGYGGVAMGAVTFGHDLEGALGVANVGNPHVVVRDEVTWPDVQREAIAERMSSIEGGANVEFVTVLDRANLDMRVIERGVGWTLACGTGSYAAAAVCHRVGLCDHDVVVHNPGGPLRVQLEGDQATLSGPVRFVADVEWLET